MTWSVVPKAVATRSLLTVNTRHMYGRQTKTTWTQKKVVEWEEEDWNCCRVNMSRSICLQSMNVSSPVNVILQYFAKSCHLLWFTLLWFTLLWFSGASVGKPWAGQVVYAEVNHSL